MRLARWLTIALLVLTISSALPSFVSAAPAQKKKGGKEEGIRKQDPERAITGLIRGMQMDLESGSSRGFLASIDSAKFEDYPRFEDMIERLTREDILRVYFRQTSNSIKDNSAQVIVDADMELTRKASAGQLDRRRQQIVIDFEATSRGWKIINITPRDFFRPL
ncbi:MAG: hypothetical protein HYX72_04365 [Acidobacteria bacterium]|nr:hypothetical protein [Acidobacteriota bacterium]